MGEAAIGWPDSVLDIQLGTRGLLERIRDLFNSTHNARTSRRDPQRPSYIGPDT